MGIADGARAKLAFIRANLEQIAVRAAEAYVGKLQGQGDPIVDRRFRGEGNARFVRLKPATAARKAGFLGQERAAGRVRSPFGREVWMGGHDATGKTGSQLVKGVTEGGGANLPILVGADRYRKGVKVHSGGTLRQAVALNRSLTRIVARGSGRARITWRGQPAYAIYHHLGLGKLPKRSPYAPNAEDRAAIVQAVRAWIETRMALLRGKVPQSAGQFGPARVIGPRPTA